LWLRLQPRRFHDPPSQAAQSSAAGYRSALFAVLQPSSQTPTDYTAATAKGLIRAIREIRGEPDLRGGRLVHVGGSPAGKHFADIAPFRLNPRSRSQIPLSGSAVRA
jgi:hypothetical protein